MDGVSFEESALTGTITRTSDSKAADLEHAAVPDDAGAKVVDLVVVDVQFEESTYTVAETDDATTTDEEEHKVEVTVTLSADPEREVIIPITRTNEGGATNSDYSGVPTSVTFNSGDTEKTFTFTATADTVDDDREKVKLSFGTLPAGVTAGTTSETTVSITDDDFPRLTVSFGASTYSVAEGFSVTIEVTLSADPERDLLIPLTRTFLGTASTDDLDSESPTTVQFNDDNDQTTISFRTEQDTVPDHGESVRLGFGDLPEGITASGTTTTTVTIIDDDPEVSITFGALADVDYTIAEGEQVVVPVMLSAAPQRPLSIPITFSYMGGGTADDHMCTGATAVFTATQTTHDMTCTIVQDTIPDSSEIIQTNFGTLPPGVIPGRAQDRTVQIIIIDDDPPVTVSFDEATYDVAEGDTASVTFTLSANPMRHVVVPITVTALGDASGLDHGARDTSFRFTQSLLTQTVTFAVDQDPDPDHGEGVRLSFGTLPPGVSAGDTATATVNFIDDDPAVTVEFGAATYKVIEGRSALVGLTLSEAPQRPLTIPVTFTNQGGATVLDHDGRDLNVSFTATQPGGSLSFTILQDTTADDGESILLSLGTLPPGVSAGSTSTSTVTIIDDDPAVTVSFGAATYSVDEGDSVDVTVTLSADPQRTVTIPITATNRDGASSADYTDPTSVTFNSGETTKTISFSSTEDTIDDDDEKVRLAFGTFPPGVSAGSTRTTTVSIDDDDDPAVRVWFDANSVTGTEGAAGVVVEILMSTQPERTVTIPLTVTLQGGASSADYSGVPASVTFGPTDTIASFTVTVVDDDIDDDGESVKIAFGALPSRVAANLSETTVNLNDNDTRGVTITPTALSIVELAWADYTVVLDT